jgi:hypothetical protein
MFNVASNFPFITSLSENVLVFYGIEVTEGIQIHVDLLTV